MRAPATLLAIPLTVGCALGLTLGEYAPPLFGACAAAAALLALVSAVGVLASRDSPAEGTVCLVAGALVVGVSLGVDAAVRAYRAPLLLWFEDRHPAVGPVVLQGRLREDAALTPAGVSVVVEVREVEPCESAPGPSRRGDRCAIRGGVRLSVAGSLAPGAMGEWRAGRTVRVTTTLREPTVYRNPGVPDERRALARRGIALVGSAKSAAMVEVIARGSPVDERASAFRAWVRRVLAGAVAPWSARSAGVAAAIAIGDRTGLTQDDEERLQIAGTYHVIAISGGNIAILTILLVGACRWLGASPRLGAAAAIIVLLSYGQVTGPAPSVDRAISAAVLFLGGRLLEQRGPSTNILAVAAALGLAVSPAAVLDPGFLLSFGATLGILIGVPRLTRVSGKETRRAHGPLAALRLLARGVSTVVAATVAAEIALAPIGAALFGRVTCAGLVLNLAAIPLMTVVQAGTLVALGAWLFDPDLARACGFGVHVAARGLIDSARLVDFAPWLSRELAPPAWWLLAAYYCALVLALVPSRASRSAGMLTALLGLLIVVGPHAATRDGVVLPPPGSLRVVFLDAGQGDATLVVVPGGRAFLVDAGGLPPAPLQDPADGPAFDIGERVVSRALRAYGVRALDTFVLTHADPDHIGGARAILRSFRPRAVWEGVPVPPHAPLERLADAADRIGAEWRTVQAGDRLRIADVEIHVLHPPPPEWERQRVRNDDSIVLAVRMGRVSVILPGDVAREGEAQTLAHLEGIEPAPIVVLKAPHHGSATSSTRELLDRLRPAAVIFSAGRANRFGHPAPAVVERYRAMGTTMFSTAEDGAVTLDTDGERVEIRTWGGRVATLGGSASHSSDEPSQSRQTSR
jgi:competence protein ComEC